MAIDTVGISNYFIGKGIVSFKKDGDMDFRDMGNAPTVEFTPTLDQLEHFSSRGGVKTKDRTVVTAKSGTLHIVLEEWTKENLALALLGDLSTNSDSQDVVEIFASNTVSGQLKVEGTNEVGAQWTSVFNKVKFIPGQAVSLISEEWAVLDMNGNVSATGTPPSFGTATRVALEGEEPTT